MGPSESGSSFARMRHPCDETGMNGHPPWCRMGSVGALLCYGHGFSRAAEGGDGSGFSR